MKKEPRYLIFLIVILILVFAVPCIPGAPLNGTLTKITVGFPSAYPYEPGFSGDYIVWRDDRTGVNNIFLYDIRNGTERPLTNGTGHEEKPAVSGHYVVWQDNRFSGAGNGYDIVLYDLNTRTSTRIANLTGDQTEPSIDGDIVVWQDRRNGVNADIYRYSISTGIETRVTSAGGDQVYPRVSCNIIVWENDTFWPRTLGMYDHAGNRTAFQPAFFDSATDQARPAVRNDYLVWSDNRPDQSFYRIYRMNLTTAASETITPDNHNHISPDTDGTRVVWIENDDIFVNDTSIPESETQITFTYGATVKDNLRISGNRIVWWETDGATNTVYLFTIGAARNCLVADFTIQPSQSGPVPFTVNFTDTSLNPAGNRISHWNWNFGDGNKSRLRNPVWTFDRSGNFDVVLTVDNPLCRNATEIGPQYRITAGAAPVPGISASTLSGMVPLTITFTDTSADATAWNWSFGDGAYAETSPVTHTYSRGGTFTVRLEDANAWGRSNTSVTVHALTGTNENASTNIRGIVVTERFGGQFLIYNGTMLPGYLLPTGSTLISPPLTRYGWQNITFRSGDGIGFRRFGNGTIMGNLSGVQFLTTEKTPFGFSPATGTQSSVYFTMDLPAYPVGGTMNTQIWEGVLPSDLEKFRMIAHGGGWSHVLATAYTIKNSLTRFSPSGPAKLYVSVNSTWVANNYGRNQTFVVRIGDDNKGEVLPTWFLYADPVTNLDYFEAESPHGMSTFGLAQLHGSGNPLQLITLTVTQHAAPPEEEQPASDSSDQRGGAMGAVGAPTAALSATPSPRPTEDPGQSAKVYTNANGTVTQATLLRSTDGLATISIGEGIVAKDAQGNPLTTITLKALPPGSLPAVPSGSAFSFAGMAYELGPDGSEFAPHSSFSLTPPVMRWGQDYAVRSFDGTSGTWQDLPTSFNTTTGTITAQVSHLCTFALFAKIPDLPTAPAAIPVVLPSAAEVQAQPPATAVSIFTNMMAWAAGLVMDNVVVLLVIAALIGGVYLYRQGKFPGSGQ